MVVLVGAAATAEALAIAETSAMLTAERTAETEVPIAANETSGTSGDTNSNYARLPEPVETPLIEGMLYLLTTVGASRQQ